MTGFFQRLDGDARDGLDEVAGEIGRPPQLLPEQFAGKPAVKNEIARFGGGPVPDAMQPGRCEASSGNAASRSQGPATRMETRYTTLHFQASSR